MLSSPENEEGASEKAWRGDAAEGSTAISMYEQNQGEAGRLWAGHGPDVGGHRLWCGVVATAQQPGLSFAGLEI